MSRIRPTILKLFAIGLASSGIFLISRPPIGDLQHVGDSMPPHQAAPGRQFPATVENRKSDPVAGTSGKNAAAGTHKSHSIEVQHHGSYSEITRSRAAITGAPPISHRPDDHTSKRTGTVPPARRSDLIAVQLADNVRLPAALMPQEGPASPGSAIAEATAEIANTFYRDLQSEVAEPQSNQNAGDEGKDAEIIPNIPETEQIRQRADEQYRALYGDEKYNRQMLDSAVEVRLSPLPAQ